MFYLFIFIYICLLIVYNFNISNYDNRIKIHEQKDQGPYIFLTSVYRANSNGGGKLDSLRWTSEFQTRIIHSSSVIHTLAVIIIDPENTAFSPFISTLFIISLIH